MTLEKFDAQEAEARIYKMWEDAGCFKAGANAHGKNSASTYSIMIPPPNVTGVLHMGHAFNNTLQDILMRWKRMQGFDTLWQAGTDHAGIATQMVVERQLNAEGKKRTDFSREEFLSKIWAWKEQSGGTIVSQLKRLGASCDWDRTAFTMAGAQGDTRVGHENSPNFHDAVIKVFVDMYNKGFIYRGKRLVNWDPHFETAISDLEVENIEVAGHMWHFKYPLADGVTYTYREKDEDGNVTLEEERDYISIATTRPETMLGDGAVAVHPDDERYAPIVGKLCEIPVGPKEHRRLIPIITDEYPDPDFGSGAVKITGAHDFNDYQVAKRGGIPMYRLMDMKGHMRADGAPYAEEAAKAQAHANGASFTENEVDVINLIPDDIRGLDRFEARKVVVDQITSEGLAVMVEVPGQARGANAADAGTADVPDTDPGPQLIPYVEHKPIMQPFGDRSKVVIEPMLTDQWFVDAEKVVGPALDAVNNGDIKLLPEREKKVWDHWLENIEPWCISRQLWWGHQIPVWYGPKDNCVTFTDDPAATQASIERFSLGDQLAFAAATKSEVKELAEVHYQNWGQKEIVFCDRSELTRDKILECVSKGQIPLYRDPDVLDTWFSSGLWPIGTLGWPDWDESTSKYFPTSDLITGTDILFFWVARMVMMQMAVLDDKPVAEKIPFSTVYLHGLVRDAKGKKMSKSTGNVIDPLDIIDEYGADALRFSSAAMAALGGVLKLDMQRIAGYRNFGTKLWNACRFAEMNEAYPADTTAMPTNMQNSVNNWIVGEVGKVRESVDASLTAYRFNDAASTLYAFVWGTVCDWYVELSKPLLQGDDAAAKAETQATLAWVLDQCLILLHPIMPFITEELWVKTGDRTNMLVHQPWPQYGAELVDDTATTEVEWVITLIENIRSARAQVNVPSGSKIPMVKVTCDAVGQNALDANFGLIQRLARITEVTSEDAMPKGAITVSAPGATFGLPLAGIIDVDAEKARLEKNVGKLQKELGGLRGRLKNPKFAESAPEEVVAEARENLAAREEEEAKLADALARLAEMA